MPDAITVTYHTASEVPISQNYGSTDTFEFGVTGNVIVSVVDGDIDVDQQDSAHIKVKANGATSGHITVAYTLNGTAKQKSVPVTVVTNPLSMNPANKDLTLSVSDDTNWKVDGAPAGARFAWDIKQTSLSDIKLTHQDTDTVTISSVAADGAGNATIYVVVTWTVGGRDFNFYIEDTLNVVA